MREGSILTIGTIILCILLAIFGVVSITLQLYEIAFQTLGILLAFFLATISAEAVRVRNEESVADSVIDDIIGELKGIQESLGKPDAAVFYSATWSYVKTSGLPKRIPSKLRKAFADALLTLDQINDIAQALRDAALHPNIGSKRIEDLRRMHQEAKDELERLTKQALDLYESMK